MQPIFDILVEPISQSDINIKIKTNHQVQSITIIYGDPHDYTKTKLDFYQWNHREQTLELTNQSKLNKYFETIIHPTNNRCKYYFKIDLENSEPIFYGQKGYFGDNTHLDLYSTFYYPYIHENEIYKEIDWIKNQVWCQIFIDRFRNGDSSINPDNTQAWDDPNITPTSFYGGDLRGIINELDHLHQLGFTGLYLTPIFHSPSNHKYDTIDYFQIDPHFGTKEDLKELVTECHKRDMKILLDAVFNHSGYHFKPFQDVITHKNNSNYADWFHITNFDPLHYETFSTVKYMPKLRTTHKDLKAYLIDVLTYYIKEFDIDGWRFDVANEIDKAFIREAHQAVKQIKPNAYLLAEIWHDPSNWITPELFDANMEYESGHVFVSWLNDEISTSQLSQRLLDINHRTPINRFSNQFHLIDSHDTPRLINQVGFDKAKALMALFFLALQKGSICLFYGTHYLLEGENDPYCRIPYPLNPTQDQLEVQKIIQDILQFRKHHLSLIQNESFTIKEKDNQIRFDYPALSITFDRVNKTINYSSSKRSNASFIMPLR